MMDITTISPKYAIISDLLVSYHCLLAFSWMHLAAYAFVSCTVWSSNVKGRNFKKKSSSVQFSSRTKEAPVSFVKSSTSGGLRIHDHGMF